MFTAKRAVVLSVLLLLSGCAKEETEQSIVSSVESLEELSSIEASLALGNIVFDAEDIQLSVTASNPRVQLYIKSHNLAKRIIYFDNQLYEKDGSVEILYTPETVYYKDSVLSLCACINQEYSNSFSLSSLLPTELEDFVTNEDGSLSYVLDESESLCWYRNDGGQIVSASAYPTDIADDDIVTKQTIYIVSVTDTKITVTVNGWRGNEITTVTPAYGIPTGFNTDNFEEVSPEEILQYLTGGNDS